VDRYLTDTLSPRSASASFALARFMPTRFGTLTVWMLVGGTVVGGDVEVVDTVAATVGREKLVVGGAVD
jgi:hypothetical protein